MKKLLIYFLLFTSACLAGEKLIKKDSSAVIKADSAVIDSIDISKIVKYQVESAMTGVVKTSINYQMPKEIVTPDVKEPELKKEVQANNNFPENLFVLFGNLGKNYMNILIFISVSVLITLVVVAKRFFRRTGKTKKGLQKNIEILRNEKLIVNKSKNKKLKLIRKNLSDSSELYSMTERHISEKAKGMQVGKGELMLAAKLKAFELSKIFK